MPTGDAITRRGFLKTTSIALGSAGLALDSRSLVGENARTSPSGPFALAQRARTHDLRLPDWGCYNNLYNGLAHTADLQQGLSFELGVFPGFFRREVLVPNVKWVSGFHPWEAAPDLSYYSYRYELLWKDQLYCDVSFSTIDDQARLIRAEFVNHTRATQNAVLHYMGYLYFPRLRPYSEEILQRVQPKLPDGAVWVNAIDYEDLRFATPRPTDNLVPGAFRRGEIRDHGLVSGSGVGAGFGKQAGDALTYRITVPAPFQNAALMLRYRTAAHNPARVAVQLGDQAERQADLPATTDFAVAAVPLGAVDSGTLRLRLSSIQPAPFDLDGFALVEAVPESSVSFDPVATAPVPQILSGPVPNSLLLKYQAAPGYYGLAWKHEPSEVREFHHSELDRFFRRNVQDHVHKVQVGDRKGHFTNVFMRPIVLPPGSSKIIYGMAASGTRPEVEAAISRFPRANADLDQVYNQARSRRQQFAASPAGEPARFSQERMAATLLTNVVFPVYGKRSFFRHNSPGKWWDSLYTWDSGFIALGLTELDLQRAIDCLNAYTTEPGDPQTAFMHIGTPLPVQIFHFWELWNRTQSKELLEYFYPRLRQYHMFLAGRHGGSTTRRLKSNLLVTWDYFYNTGWDDYPPQQYMHEKALTRSLAPVITTAHAIRTAKMLRAAAVALAQDKDVGVYDEDIGLWTEAIQTHCWDAEAGYYSYVMHDDQGRPKDILRHSAGQNFNMGLDGVSPLVAGIGTPAQFQAQLANLQSDRHLWTRIGLSTVDQSAAYYRRDGYWNGAVWMPHQWFIWKSLLDWGAGAFAFQLASTAINLWKTEVDESYHCFEHFLIDSGRGAGWHQFGALSSPVLSWFAAYYVPGHFTAGFDTWVQSSAWADSNRRLELQLSFAGDRVGKSSFVAAMNPDSRYRVSWNGAEASHVELAPGVLQLDLATQPRQGRLQVQKV